MTEKERGKDLSLVQEMQDTLFEAKVWKNYIHKTSTQNLFHYIFILNKWQMLNYFQIVLADDISAPEDLEKSYRMLCSTIPAQLSQQIQNKIKLKYGLLVNNWF